MLPEDFGWSGRHPARRSEAFAAAPPLRGGGFFYSHPNHRRAWLNMTIMNLSVLEIVLCVVAAAVVLWQAVEVLLRGALTVFEKIQRKYGIPRNVMTGKEGLIGQTALVVRSFEPVGYGRSEGLVFLGGATWNARLKDGVERASRPFLSVRVEEVDGLTLIVSKMEG